MSLTPEYLRGMKSDMFATRDSMESLQDYLALFSGGEAVVAQTCASMAINTLLEQLAQTAEAPEPAPGGTPDFAAATETIKGGPFNLKNDDPYFKHGTREMLFEAIEEKGFELLGDPILIEWAKRIGHRNWDDDKAEAELWQTYIQAADEKYGRDGDLEFDDNTAEVSLGDDPGAYVQGWRWVAASDAGIEVDEED